MGGAWRRRGRGIGGGEMEMEMDAGLYETHAEGGKEGPMEDVA